MEIIDELEGEKRGVGYGGGVGYISAGGEADIAREDRRMGGYQEDVVKRQRLLEQSHSEFLRTKNALYARARAAFSAPCRIAGRSHTRTSHACEAEQASIFC
jgi:hypothetical protein